MDSIEMGSTQAPKMPANPLEKIALCCSGGGYRAAGFHLGSMSYLDRLQYKNGETLLDRVKMISTVSGGTFTGVIYALHKQKRETFKEIYHFILTQLSKVDLVKLAIQKLNPDVNWTETHKRKNLINAFSELYDEHFTEGETLEVFDTLKCHLEAVVFNSTEFNNAINFRFRNKGTGLIGNKFNNVEQALASEIKLADIIAASSCFPGGFEPIMWPADFAHNKAKNINDKIATLKPAGLMDGGIYDNQGIDSVLLYKKKNEPYFDLVIVSDVASPFMDPFLPATERPKKGWLTMTVREFGKKVKRINIWVNGVMIFLAALFAILPIIKGYPNNFLTGLSTGVSLMLLVVLVSKLWVGGMVKRKIRQGLSAIHDWIVRKNLEFYYQRLSLLKIEELSIHRVKPLLTDRFNSLLSLMLNVFLKVVRRLNYKLLYENPKWMYRRMSNLIYELTEKDFGSGEKIPHEATDSSKDEPALASTVTGKVGSAAPVKSKTFVGPYLQVVGPKIKEVAETAASFGTTLWFTEGDVLQSMLNSLVATGQFTMCYNLIDYIESLKADPKSGYQDLDPVSEAKVLLDDLHRNCLDDWDRFKKDPFFLMTEMKSNASGRSAKQHGQGASGTSKDDGRDYQDRAGESKT
jgi:predicted acylesterase/phospholipase RssA